MGRLISSRVQKDDEQVCVLFAGFLYLNGRIAAIHRSKLGVFAQEETFQAPEDEKEEEREERLKQQFLKVCRESLLRFCVRLRPCGRARLTFSVTLARPPHPS